ncbi:hypothetical protein BGZ92_001372, partial [Podila epicladia]
MDQDDEERQLAEAICLSLLESGVPVEEASSFRRDTNRNFVHASQTISLSDDDDEFPIFGREFPLNQEPYYNSGIDSSNDDSVFGGVPVPRRGVSTHEQNRRDQRRVEVDREQSEEDEEEKQLKLALELSLKEAKARIGHEQPAASTAAKEESTTAGTPVGSILGMSRVEMERQRQERLLAKKRPNVEMESSSTLGDRHDTKRRFGDNGDKIPSEEQSTGSTSTLSRFSKFAAPSISTTTPIVSPFALEPAPNLESSTRRTSFSKHALPKPLRDNPGSSTSTFSKTCSAASSSSSYGKSGRKPAQMPVQLEMERLQTLADLYPIQYTEATFKNTYIKGSLKGPNTVRINDLIDREYIQKAVLTAFQMDPVWLERYLPRTVPQ